MFGSFIAQCMAAMFLYKQQPLRTIVVFLAVAFACSQVARAQTIRLTCTQTSMTDVSGHMTLCARNDVSCGPVHLILDTQGHRVRVGDSGWLSAAVSDAYIFWQLRYPRSHLSYNLDRYTGVLDISSFIGDNANYAEYRCRRVERQF